MAVYAGLEADALGNIVEVADIIGKFGKGAAKLAAGLGIWGTLLGFVQLGNPTPQDIIDACNKALKTLTDDVNKQFTNMQAYVDQAVLDLEKELTDVDFTQYHIYFTSCIKEVSDTNINQCMEEAERLSGSDFNRFMPYLNEMSDPSWKPTAENVKKLEIHFMSFRNYAQLRILTLLTLATTYRDFESDDAASMDYAVKQAARYYTALKTETAKYADYGKKVYNFIHNMYNQDVSYVEQKTTCGDKEDVYEGGWGKVLTQRHYICKILMSPVLVSTQTCQTRSGVRMDGKCPPSSCSPCCAGCADSLVASKGTSVKEFTPLFKEYQEKMVKQLEFYWKPQVTAQIPLWESIHTQLEKMVSSKYSSVVPDTNYLSEDQNSRISKFQQELDLKRFQYRDDISVHASGYLKNSEL